MSISSRVMDAFVFFAKQTRLVEINAWTDFPLLDYNREC